MALLLNLLIVRRLTPTPTASGAVTRFQGHVAKYMGDGILCYFGWPNAHEDDAERVGVPQGLSLFSIEAIPSTICEFLNLLVGHGIDFAFFKFNVTLMTF